MPDITAEQLANIVTLTLAAIGAAYTLARAVVMATPTKADDAWLTKCDSVIMLLCRVFGLTTNQGITKR